MRRRPELLAPAGTPEKLRMAFAYGADAAYLGGEQFGLRAFGGNFSQDEMRTAVRLAHASEKKIYVTVNVFPHNEDIAASLCSAGRRCQICPSISARRRTM